MRETVSARLERQSSPAPEGGCRIWNGKLDFAGYGVIKVRGKTAAAHRVAYEEARGPIPAGQQIDHLCRTPRCINPAHLQAVSLRENVRRAIVAGSHPAAREAAQTHCQGGHPFNDENTYITKHGGRVCRVCRAARARERLARPKVPRDPARCVHGHELTPDNVRTGSRGARVCLTCQRERHRAYRARLKKAARTAPSPTAEKGE